MLSPTPVSSEESCYEEPTDAAAGRGGAEIRWKHPRILDQRREQFGDVCAELFACESNEMNELEIFASTHCLMMRCAGVASRCEIDWPGEGSKKLPELRHGAILFTPACGTVRARKRDHGRFCSLALQIHPSTLERLDDDGAVARLTLAPQAGPGDVELCRVIGAMYEEMQAPGPAGRLYKESLGLQLLVQLVRQASNLALTPPKGGLAGWQVRRATELIESDLSETPSLHHLADHVGLSPSHFCTAFKQSTGLPPHRYLLTRRVACAKRLMADPKLNLTTIGLSSGFTSSTQFATTFRRIEGMTPTAYRRAL